MLYGGGFSKWSAPKVWGNHPIHRGLGVFFSHQRAAGVAQAKGLAFFGMLFHD